MACSCIRGNSFNFSLEYDQCGTLLYQDLSDWMCEYEIPATYTLQMSVYGGTPVDISISTTGYNTITTEKFGANIIDGLYCFKTTACGVEYTRTKAVTCILDCKLDHVIATAKTHAEYANADKIAKYIQAIHYNAERDFIDEAKYFYSLAKQELSCVNCNC